jgi:penicillin amidase
MPRVASALLRRSALSLALLSLAALAGCSADESLNPSSAVPAPQALIDFIVDDLGITHVYAQSDADALFGAGYAMARDRLFQMELSRRQAFGQRAELLGESVLTSDIGSRAINFRKLGEADAARLRAERPEEAALVDAWASGVNLRIAEIARGAAPRPYGLGPAELDFVPEPWTAAHAFAVGKVLVFGLSNSFDAELLATALTRLVPKTVEKLPIFLPAYDTFITGTEPQSPEQNAKPRPPEGVAGPPLPPGAPEFPAGYEPMFPAMESNNWAVDGAHSENGKPLLAGDPHQALTSPTRLWPVHMSSVAAGGTLDVIGFSFVGTPMVELGHNAHIGWTATTNFADAMDFWDVPAGASNLIELGGETHPIETRTETIRVRNLDRSMREVTIDLRDVPGFGILLPEEILPIPRQLLVDGAILFRWTGFSPTLEVSAFLGLDRAVDLDGFEAAVDRIEVGALNMVAAHERGIDYHVHARVPDRGDPSSRPMPWRIQSGEDPESLWSRGELPPAKLPHLKDPERGFVCSANNDPFGFTADGDVENDPYYYGAFFANGFRARRIEERLSALLAERKASRADMEELQGDVHSLMADTVLPHLAEAVSAIPTDPALAVYQGRGDLLALADRLAAWDRRLDRAQAAPVIFVGLEWFAVKRAFAAQLTPPLFDAIAEKSPSFLVGMLRNVLEGRFADVAAFTPGGQRLLMLAALDDTAAWLSQRFGSLDAPFKMGDVHFADFPSTFGGRLTVPRVAVGGGDDTVNVSPAAFFAGGKVQDAFLSHEQSLYRMVVGFGADGVPEATLNFAMGTSEDPDSLHFLDQQERWANVDYTPLPFRKADVEARATERRRLSSR